MRSNIFDRLSFLFLFFVVVLLPVFCLPFTNIPVEISKGLLLVSGLVLCIISWAIARFIDGKIVLPRSYLLLSGFFVVVVSFISALLSDGREMSLFGIMLDLGSFYFIFSGFFLMLMSSIVFSTFRRTKILFWGIIFSSVALLLFQTAHLFFPNYLSLGILSEKTGNIFGSWNALGLFAGFISLLLLLMVEFFQLSKIEKIFTKVSLLLSLFVVAVVSTASFSLAWVLVGLSSLIIFVYKVSTSPQSTETEKKNFPLIVFIVMIVSLLFFISGSFGNKISDKLQISNPEVSLSFNSTLSTTKGVLSRDPLWGTGPNKFEEAWKMYKPISINQTLFWDTSFSSGSGLLPTLLATTGILGILSWISFIGILLWFGIKTVLQNIKEKTNWEVIISFILSLYLLTASLFYFTGVVIFLLFFVFVGMFIGLSSFTQDKKIYFSFLNDPRKSFFSILFLVLFVVFSVIMSFKYMERLVSISYFGKALSATTVETAETYINKALSLHSNDLYLRTYSQIALVKLSSIVNKSLDLSESDKEEIQKSFDKAVGLAQLALDYNPSSYSNFQMLGSVYREVGALGVEGAYAKSLDAYKSSSLLNPSNPGPKVAMANVLFLEGRTEEAKSYVNEALSLKADHVDSFIVLSQIAKSEGNNKEALSYAQRALSIAPSDKNLIEYVNSLKTSSTSTPTPN